MTKVFERRSHAFPPRYTPDGTPLWSMGNFITSSRFLSLNIALWPCDMLSYELSCLLHCSLPHNHYCCILLYFYSLTKHTRILHWFSKHRKLPRKWVSLCFFRDYCCIDCMHGIFRHFRLAPHERLHRKRLWYRRRKRDLMAKLSGINENIT